MASFPPIPIDDSGDDNDCHSQNVTPKEISQTRHANIQSSAFCATKAIELGHTHAAREYLSKHSLIIHGITQYSQVQQECKVQFGIAFVPQHNTIIISFKQDDNFSSSHAAIEQRSELAARFVPSLPVPPILAWLEKGIRVVLAVSIASVFIADFVRCTIHQQSPFQENWTKYDELFSVEVLDLDVFPRDSVPRSTDDLPVLVVPLSVGDIKLRPFTKDDQMIMEICHPSLWFILSTHSVVQRFEAGEEREHVFFNHKTMIQASLHPGEETNTTQRRKGSIWKKFQSSVRTSMMKKRKMKDQPQDDEKKDVQLEQERDSVFKVLHLIEPTSALDANYPVQILVKTMLDDPDTFVDAKWQVTLANRRVQYENLPPEQAAWTVIPLMTGNSAVAKQLTACMESFRDDVQDCVTRIEDIMREQESKTIDLQCRQSQTEVAEALQEITSQHTEHQEEEKANTKFIHATTEAETTAERCVGQRKNMFQTMGHVIRNAGKFAWASVRKDDWIELIVGEYGENVESFLEQENILHSEKERQTWAETFRKKYGLVIPGTPTWLVLCEIAHVHVKKTWETSLFRLPADDDEKAYSDSEGEQSSVAGRSVVSASERLNRMDIAEYFRTQIFKKLGQIGFVWMKREDEFEAVIDQLVQKKLHDMSCTYAIYNILSRQKIMGVFGTKCAGKTTFCHYFGHPSQAGLDRDSYYPHPFELPANFILIDFPHFDPTRPDCQILKQFRDCVCDIVVLVFDAKNPGTDRQQAIFRDAVSVVGFDRVIVLFNRCDEVILDRRESMQLQKLTSQRQTNWRDRRKFKGPPRSTAKVQRNVSTVWKKSRFEDYKSRCKQVLGFNLGGFDPKNIFFTCLTQLNVALYDEVFEEFFASDPESRDEKHGDLLVWILENEWEILPFEGVLAVLCSCLPGYDDDWDALHDYCHGVIEDATQSDGFLLLEK